MAALKLQQLRKTYDDGNEIIKGIDLDIRDGEFMVFVGPSGCGKSTTLRMIAGLEEISGGSLHIGDRQVNEVPPAQRGVAMVFQSYALYPHMTVRENMGFALKLAKHSKAAIDEAVERAANILQISHLLDRKPKALSGGQRQRVAIGRAIVRTPQVFLFDEPLSNLDAALRVQMRIELARLHEELATTMIYVTHDQVEAMTLGDRIAVYNAGRIEQVGTPLELYERPANLFVAGFLGSPKMNFLPASIACHGEAGTVALLAGGSKLVLNCKLDHPAGAAITLGIRPENLSWQAGPADAGIPVRIELVEHLGGEQIVYASHAGCSEQLAFSIAGNTSAPKRGDLGSLHPASQTVLAFDAQGVAIRHTHKAACLV
ncbi:ABC transporter ATP-binding protein [Chitinimonas sp.]|uniref:ABC transporter ATP-binding protein n=1 Tax=Chitinimonas sp. TaxID=1934313 RepID=UPI0035B4B85F